MPRRATQDTRPPHIQVWTTLYNSGWTCEEIAADHRRSSGQHVTGEWVRRQLIKHGVEMRRPGGRRALKHNSTTRIAMLEISLSGVQEQLSEALEKLEKLESADGSHANLA